VSSPASCSSLSLALGEPLPGTASHAASWLLVEQPGPWGRFALRESRLDPVIGAELERRASAAGVSVLLVKQPGRRRPSGTRRVFAASSRPGETFLEALELSSAGELLELDLGGLGSGRRLGGAPVGHPLFLVCTNGRRDACCALKGRPIAEALSDVYPGAAWECSHTGGHRFAGVLICLPDGLVYGRLEPETALRAASSYEERRIELPWFRGRSSYEPAAQAADAYLRLHDGLAGVDDVTVADASNGAVVLERSDGARFAVSVRREEADPPRPNSCRDRGTEGKRPLVWLLDAIEPA
jgi:hypothetical protein